MIKASITTTVYKDHPILFHPLMVQSRKAGLKYVTRCLSGLDAVNGNPAKWQKNGLLEVTKKGKLVQKFTASGVFSTTCECPYGVPGDYLWVRENFQYKPLNSPGTGCYYYQADNATVCKKWKPSKHMPKDAARFWNRITSVRCERLQDITEIDSVREGVQPVLMSAAQVALHGQLYHNYLEAPDLFSSGVSPMESFKSLIIFLHSPAIWDKNPWVWVVDFVPAKQPD